MTDKKKLARRERALLRKLGFDTRNMSAADIAEGAEAARRCSACGCGADPRQVSKPLTMQKKNHHRTIRVG
jgi:hypothetical protein